MKYIPLNIKTEYDLMNSLIKIDDLISYALKNNIDTLGITDSNMFGTLEFINKCNSNNIKPIVGLSININDISFYLYAVNYDGLCRLYEIVSIKNINGLTFDNIITNNNLICVCDKKDYDYLKNIFENIYVYYNLDNKDEVLNSFDNSIYLKDIRYFNKEDGVYYKYLKYIDLGKTILDELIVKDYSFDNNVSSDDYERLKIFIDKINIVLPNKKLHIPKYNEDSSSYLKALAKKGLEKRLNGNVTDLYKNRLVYELSIIEKMNFTDYFLIVYDFILYAKKNNIFVGPGRGSGAASLVNYSLGIIDIDPLKYNLIFERFLNPDRITMPDIDIDFDNLKRENVINYVINKYGELNTARIISFNTMLPKQIIRDVSRVINFDSLLTDKICKTIGNEKNFLELKNNREFIKLINKNDSTKDLIKICNKLCGLKKNTSMHAAGVVISDVPLNNFMPLYKVNNVILTGFSMEHIESLGLLKMDFLAIKNLNTISNIIEELKSNNINIDINNIDLNDKEVLNLFKNAYTTGIFQFESDGMKSFLRELNVDSFNTLIDAIALYRPGPREMIPEYIRNKKNLNKIKYLIKELEVILKSTYGIIIYQEQVLEILRTIGGFSYAEADNIRRAMSKKKENIIIENKDKFINGVISKGYDEKVGLELYNLIIKFSSYGFNKSHSVVYSLVAYQMAYLKVHFSLYFMKNLLNMNKSSELIKEYIDESKILGITFNNISINSSNKNFIINNNSLILPFTLIKSIGENVSDEIVIEREKKSFNSFYDFMIRCYGKNINKRVVISLIQCGAFNEFNLNKKQTILSLDEIINYVSLCRDLNVKLDEPMLENIDDFNDEENINNEINNYGFYLSFHPVTKYDRNNTIKTNEIIKYFNKTITTILYLENIKKIKTKNNDDMAFIKLSDEYSSIEGIIFSNELNKIGEIERNKIYKINGKIEKRNNNYQLIIYNMIKI